MNAQTPVVLRRDVAPKLRRITTASCPVEVLTKSEAAWGSIKQLLISWFHFLDLIMKGYYQALIYASNLLRPVIVYFRKYLWNLWNLRTLLLLDYAFMTEYLFFTI
jgi:hypothetical protein